MCYLPAFLQGKHHRLCVWCIYTSNISLAFTSLLCFPTFAAILSCLFLSLLLPSSNPFTLHVYFMLLLLNLCPLCARRQKRTDALHNLWNQSSLRWLRMLLHGLIAEWMPACRITNLKVSGGKTSSKYLKLMTEHEQTNTILETAWFPVLSLCTPTQVLPLSRLDPWALRGHVQTEPDWLADLLHFHRSSIL